MLMTAKRRQPVPMAAHHMFSVVNNARAMVSRTMPSRIDNVFVMFVVF